jgi:cellulose synthase/poly-beta-1,6-N-acetylglucosamine synthase-like glycosyltransferase
MAVARLKLVSSAPQPQPRPGPVWPGITEVPPDELRLYGPRGRYAPLPPVDPARIKLDGRLIDSVGAQTCLNVGVLPLRQVGRTLIVAVTDRAIVPRLPELTGHDGSFLPHLAPPGLLQELLLPLRGADLGQVAETRVPLEESCRNWSVGRYFPIIAVVLTLIGFAVTTAPEAVVIGLVIWGFVSMIASMALKIAALIAMARPADPTPTAFAPPAFAPPAFAGSAPGTAHLPTVSIIVALYHEADIAGRLVQRLGRLDYPRDCLDIILAVEEDDALTRTALATVTLPQWMRVVTVPHGPVRTKPRALNHALSFCKGSIIGVYDAEDAPAADQISRVVGRFQHCGPEVACLQGVLDFYNPSTNWLSRCFTIEYAAWFRLILPGIARLGLVLPLGGTTLFFRRAALEALGAWDAHNVTEDADLGLRLARHGYRTELTDTVTGEEANCRFLPWVRQRSRWIKGYMMTYAVHMRRPRLLLAQLGWRRFVGVQVLFLGSVSQALLIPVMWSLWIISLGFDHPARAIMPTGLFLPLIAVFVLAEATTILTGLVGMARRGAGAGGGRISLWWVPTLHCYYPLAALASYKALYEVLVRPFYWDKTSHGHFDRAAPAPAAAPALHPIRLVAAEGSMGPARPPARIIRLTAP